MAFNEPRMNQEMTIVHESPPMLDRIREAGMNPDLATTVFTYGYLLYNPGENRLSADLMAHELTHAKQQTEYAGGPDAWWDRYLTDIDFRIEQELEAYRAQFQFFVSRHRNIRKQAFFLNAIAQDFSGPLYGNVISVDEAIQHIRA